MYIFVIKFVFLGAWRHMPEPICREGLRMIVLSFAIGSYCPTIVRIVHPYITLHLIKLYTLWVSEREGVIT